MTRVLILMMSLLLWSCSSKKKDSDRPDSKAIPEVEIEAKSSHPATKHVHWGYKGMIGPEFWASLDEKYRYCKEGKAQSPIDLVWKQPASGGVLSFNYKPGKFGVVDNGHTIQVHPPMGNKVTIRGHVYELLQFHFHNSSEHTLSGQQLPLEVHFVHKDAAGNLAVVGAFFKVGRENEFIKDILTHLPSRKNVEKIVENVQLNPKSLLPDVYTYYHYYGSLTTPPCSEGVNWNVLNTPMELSSDQLLQFSRRHMNNFRPVQPLNDRELVNY